MEKIPLAVLVLEARSFPRTQQESPVWAPSEEI
jgi:hypothetical protein